MQELFEDQEYIEPELVRNGEPINETLSEIDDSRDIIEQEMPKEIKSLFDNIDESSETYATYHVYIVRETDTVETILQKYSVTKEDIEMYNDLKEIKVGDKIIIPSFNA